MNETKKSTYSSSLKYIFIIIGLVAAFASYFLVFNKYKTINEDLTSEIEGLESRRDELENKEKNRAAIEANTKENNEKCEEVLANFDGGLSYQGEIMDIHFLREDEKVEIKSLTYSAPTDITTFSNGYVGKSMNYNYSVTSTYEQMKDMLKYFTEYTGKRKVPNTVAFTYDASTNNITTSFNVNEYAVAGEDREPLPTLEPSFTSGVDNLFFNQVIANG